MAGSDLSIGPLCKEMVQPSFPQPGWRHRINTFVQEGGGELICPHPPNGSSSFVMPSYLAFAQLGEISVI